MIATVPYKYYFPLLLTFIVAACVQYTGGWEDYVILIICSIVGISAKKFKFSRPAMLFGFILAERVEALTIQMHGLYTFDRLLTRPIFWTLIAVVIAVLIWGLTKRSKLDYA
jgi:TctA family transporter